MSDSEDSDILADIQALDEALALSARKKSQPCASSSNQLSDVSSEDSKESDDYLDYLRTNRSIDSTLNVYEINTRLIAGLTITKKKLTVLLQECEQKIKLLDEKIMKSRDELSLGSKLALSNAGMPYFKDKGYFNAPKNSDAKRKEANGEIFLPSLKKPSRWSGRDRDTLLSAINNQVLELVLRWEYNNETNKSTSDDQARETKAVLPRNFDEMVGPVGGGEFDWHKISVIDFDNKHSPGECQAMWNVYLHPDFKKTEWTSTEDNRLLECVKKYKHQDWDAITQELGTNRSAYQCFIRYNTIKKVPSAGCPWTKQEDKHLLKIINVLRVGNFIPWAELANHMRHRTKQQIYVRWVYRKAPHLRKGRFTGAETSTLLTAVQKYGTNFCKISSHVMPHRTSIQLQGHYDTVTSNLKNKINRWTISDDTELINLQIKYRNDWSKIARFFPNKSRTQVRHRYGSLIRYIQRGFSLEAIPRPFSSICERKQLRKNQLSSNASKTCNKVSTLKPVQRVHGFDIQRKLYETLSFPPEVRASNSEVAPFDVEELAHYTKRLFNTLTLLKANLDIPEIDFLHYVQLNDREKQLLVSLQEYINVVKNNGIAYEELVEKRRTQMFGCTPEVGEFFVPPLPFDGYVRLLKKTLKKKKNTSIDYNLDDNKKFLIDLPIDFSLNVDVLPFITLEEEIQFHKFGHFLSTNYHDYDLRDIDLYKSLRHMKCVLHLPEETPSRSNIALPDHLELNVHSKVCLEDYEQLNETKESVNINEDDEVVNTNDTILPSQATLLGLKNLLLWKLLYDCEAESRQQCEAMASLVKKRDPEQTAANFQKTESAEYKLLRTRLLQLFKYPISLSNTILQMQGPEKIFVVKEKSNKGQNKEQTFQTRKRKYVSRAQLNIPANVKSDVTTRNLPAVRSCKIVCKKYKIVEK
ncbi:PREDICTED: uncharacterized protein LOC105560614 [Vollenhovia emeryi]|uniref:uncharacterized protein LOC105560614 n=1 Tax=Vollenhovia emeryi TaxID=411798 RepID=UPI0005F55B05|nr:PREDICTED: uncharacterized protein LOC105560614 [Vollenhovia emeryi]